MRYLIIFLISINIFANDFRGNPWGSSSKEVLEKEKLKTILLKESVKSKKFSTFKGDFQYSYNVDDYSFTDTLEDLGEFDITYSFLKDKFFKATYTKEFKEIKTAKITKKSKETNSIIPTEQNDKSFEKMKQYLIWKYGKDYKTYGFYDNFEWNNGRSKIILNLYIGRNFTVEYYADTELMKEFIDNAENGKEFIKDLGTEYKDFSKIKDKI